MGSVLVNSSKSTRLLQLTMISILDPVSANKAGSNSVVMVIASNVVSLKLEQARQTPVSPSTASCPVTRKEIQSFTSCYLESTHNCKGLEKR
jgi:hypothetical protein